MPNPDDFKPDDFKPATPADVSDDSLWPRRFDALARDVKDLFERIDVKLGRIAARMDAADEDREELRRSVEDLEHRFAALGAR